MDGELRYRALFSNAPLRAIISIVRRLQGTVMYRWETHEDFCDNDGVTGARARGSLAAFRLTGGLRAFAAHAFCCM